MPDPIKMDGQYACRIAPHDEVRVICVDGPGDYPVAFYAADGELTGADRYGFSFDTNYDLVPLQVLRKPVEAWAVVVENDVHIRMSEREAEVMSLRIPGARLVRLVEAEDGK